MFQNLRNLEFSLSCSFLADARLKIFLITVQVDSAYKILAMRSLGPKGTQNRKSDKRTQISE